MEVIEINKNMGESKGNFLTGLQRLINNRRARRFARKSKRAIKNTMRGFGQEAKETRDMAKLFFRMLENKLDLHHRKTPPTRQEVKEAIDQLKDIGRISVFSSISIIPGGGFSLIGLEILASKFGIKSFTFVPSGFRKKNRKFMARSFGSKEVNPQQPEIQTEATEQSGKSV